MTARVLLADPPWRFGDALGRRGAEANYPTLSIEQLCSFPLPPLGRDCLLMLWRVASMQEEALRLARSWGFTIKSELVWRKLTKTGKQWFGMGRYVRMGHEVCLLGVRGKVEISDHAVRSVFPSPVQEHSRKPDEIYDIARRLVPKGPYVELFARRRYPGWIAYGNQLLPANDNASASQWIKLA